MGSLKLQSFEDFANASAEATKMKLEEEQKAARTESAYQSITIMRSAICLISSRRWEM